jgi:hypothetical protein
MKLSDILGSGATVVIKNINIINTEKGDDDTPIVNPGIEYGEDDKAKWSPPLQQELSVAKNVAGVTPDADTTELNPKVEQQVEKESADKQLAFIKKLVDMLGK